MEHKLNLFIVGAAKCGTTFLNNLLGKHAAIKGINTELDTSFNYDEGHLRRLFQFDSKYSIFLGSCPYYSIHERVPQRIYNYNKTSKIIFCIRSHEERILSHINMNRVNRNESREVREIIDSDLKSIDKRVVEYTRRLYIKRTLYHPQLKRLIELFGRDKIFIFNLDNYVLSDLYNFIGVENMSFNLGTIFKRKGIPKKSSDIEILKTHKELQHLIDNDRVLLRESYGIIV